MEFSIECGSFVITEIRSLHFPILRKTPQIFGTFEKSSYICTRIDKTNNMTAIDLRASTMQILERFDKTDTSLWQKVLDAVNSIYKSQEEAQQSKKAEQKAKIRQMVGILSKESTDDWKREKEEFLTEKYQ